MDNFDENKPKIDLLADAEAIIEKYKCKYSADQYWYRDDNKWVSASMVPLIVVITRDFGKRYRNSHSKLEQIEKFVKDITRDKYFIDVKKTFSVFFLNGVVRYNKKCFSDKDNIVKYEEESFHKYQSDDERATFTPSIINDDFIGTLGSKEFEEKMNTPEGQEVIRIVHKYYDFISMDQNGKVRRDVKDYLLALGWLGHSTGTLEQITYLLGDGANGKSWFTNNVLFNLVGRTNFGSFKLDKLNDAFGYQPFLNKTLMVDPDASNTLIEDDKFKSLAGTDVVNINIKNKDAISTELFSTVILCTNHAPKYVDYSSAMSRRMVLIKLYSCVFENVNAAKRIKTKMALSDAEQKIFFNHLSQQYQRSLMFDAFCRMYDVESKLLVTPEESTSLNQELERENNELYDWVESTEWIQNELEAASNHELFVYPQYIFDKYKDFYKENNDGSDKGFGFKKNGIWQRFKELLESKYRGVFKFDTNKKVRQKVASTMPTGFVIKPRAPISSELSDEDIDTMITQNNIKIKEYLCKIDNIKSEITKLELTKSGRIKKPKNSSKKEGN